MHRSRNAVSHINMATNDHSVDLTIDKEDSVALWIELSDKHHVSAEATIVALLTDYHMVSMKDDESVTQ